MVNALCPFECFPAVGRHEWPARSFSPACPLPGAAGGSGGGGGGRRKDVSSADCTEPGATARTRRPAGGFSRLSTAALRARAMERSAHDPAPPAAAATTTTVPDCSPPAYSSLDEKEGEAARLAGDAGAVVVTVPAVDTDDKVPLTAAPAAHAVTDPLAAAAAAADDPENPAPLPAEGEADGEAEEEEWDDEQEELGSCSRSPWCHAVVYSILIAVVTFFILLFRQRLG